MILLLVSMIVSDPLEIANILKKYLEKIRCWGEQWKMAFNLDTTKFFKKQESFHPNLYFSKFVVEKNANPKAFRA